MRVSLVAVCTPSSGPEARHNRTTDRQVAAQGRPASSGDQAGPDSQPLPPGQLWRHSACEALLSACLLFGVASVVRWAVGASAISRALAGIHLELLVTGAAVGLLLAGLILSPLGKASGGHLNPAISLAMWRFGVFPGRGVLPYWAAQLAGSLLGVLAARAAWGPALARAPVAYSALRPAPGWSNLALFPAETASMAVIVVLVGVFLSLPQAADPPAQRWRRQRIAWPPWRRTAMSSWWAAGCSGWPARGP